MLWREQVMWAFSVRTQQCDSSRWILSSSNTKAPSTLSISPALSLSLKCIGFILHTQLTAGLKPMQLISCHKALMDELTKREKDKVTSSENWKWKQMLMMDWGICQMFVRLCCALVLASQIGLSWNVQKTFIWGNLEIDHLILFKKKSK